MNNFSVCRAVEHIRKARLTELKARETSCPNGKKVWMRKCRTIRIFRSLAGTQCMVDGTKEVGTRST